MCPGCAPRDLGTIAGLIPALVKRQATRWRRAGFRAGLGRIARVVKGSRDDDSAARAHAAAKKDDQNMPLSPYLARLRGRVGPELIMLTGVSACIFDEAGRVLLAHHVDSGIWALPGGAVEPDEDPAVAMAREAREELGIA